MNGAPDWQDGECCFRCRTQFTLMARKHHCRNCGNIFCAKCSSQQIPLPKLNIEKNVRVCDTCYEKIVGKNDDPLTLALDTKDTEQTKPKDTSSISKSSSSSSNSKSAASASAPSEQELKEEEEFQLALALSLSETPTKVSFPEIRSYEEPKSSAPRNQTTTLSSNSNNVAVNHSSASNGFSTQRSATSQAEMTKTMSVDYPAINQPPQLPPQMIDVPPQVIDYHHIPERDREVFKFVGDVQSTLEVFTNRLESCKLRNRPVANDAAVQSSFIRLNSEVQPKLAEYIKTYDEERADYERLQDKLSQIADARAALDALREEHQEKVREQAAEAERLRQTQLATKLEAMRQKKSEMMQYQRELALQRIKEQETLSQQQQQQQQYQPTTTQGYQVPPVTAHQDTFVGQPIVNHVHQGWQQQQQPQMSNEQYYSQVQTSNYVPVQQHYTPATNHATHIAQQQQQYVAPPTAQPSVSAPVHMAPQPPSIDRASIAHLERQFLSPPPKPDEDTPLISFDD